MCQGRVHGGPSVEILGPNRVVVARGPRAGGGGGADGGRGAEGDGICGEGHMPTHPPSGPFRARNTERSAAAAAAGAGDLSTATKTHNISDFVFLLLCWGLFVCFALKPLLCVLDTRDAPFLECTHCSCNRWSADLLHHRSTFSDPPPQNMGLLHGLVEGSFDFDEDSE